MGLKAKLFVTLVLGSLLIPSHPEPPLRTGAYVQDVTQHSAKVCWVEGAADGYDLRVTSNGAPARVQWLSTGERRVAQITGLLPATDYKFTTTCDGAMQAGLSGSFRTPPASTDSKVRFAVLGDSGGLPWWVNFSRSPLFGALARLSWLPADGDVTRIGKLLATLNPEFWIHTGDVIYPRGEQRHYEPGFFAPFAETLRRAPVYPVLGNHDWEWDHGRPFLANFELPEGEGDDGGKADGDEQFFTFAWGPVRVVGLNLNRSVGIEPGIAYMQRVLADAREPWRIVVEHFPPWSASDQGDRPDLIEHLVPALVAAKVDVLLCGHDHNYQRFQPVGNTHFVVTGGGGKSLYKLREHPRMLKAVSVYHLCEVVVDPRRFALRVLAEDGSEVDAFALDK